MRVRNLVFLVVIFIFSTTSVSVAVAFEVPQECREVAEKIIIKSARLCSEACEEATRPLVKKSIVELRRLLDLIQIQQALIKSQEVQIKYLKKKLKEGKISL